MADGPKVYGLKLLECGQLPLSLSHKNLNTVYINYSLENSTLKSFMGLQGQLKQTENLLCNSDITLLARTNNDDDVVTFQTVGAGRIQL